MSVHRVEEIAGDPADQPLLRDIELCRHLLQARVGKTENIANGHEQRVFPCAALSMREYRR
jgi:hypothetical protein